MLFRALLYQSFSIYSAVGHGRHAGENEFWLGGWVGSEYDMAWKSAVGFGWGEEESAELYAVHGYPGPGGERVSPGTWPAVMFLALF